MNMPVTTNATTATPTAVIEEQQQQQQKQKQPQPTEEKPQPTNNSSTVANPFLKANSESKMYPNLYFPCFSDTFPT